MSAAIPIRSPTFERAQQPYERARQASSAATSPLLGHPSTVETSVIVNVPLACDVCGRKRAWTRIDKYGPGRCGRKDAPVAVQEPAPALPTPASFLQKPPSLSNGMTAMGINSWGAPTATAVPAAQGTNGWGQAAPASAPMSPPRASVACHGFLSFQTSVDIQPNPETRVQLSIQALGNEPLQMRVRHVGPSKIHPATFIRLHEPIQSTLAEFPAGPNELGEKLLPRDHLTIAKDATDLKLQFVVVLPVEAKKEVASASSGTASKIDSLTAEISRASSLDRSALMAQATSSTRRPPMSCSRSASRRTARSCVLSLRCELT